MAQRLFVTTGQAFALREASVVAITGKKAMIGPGDDDRRSGKEMEEYKGLSGALTDSRIGTVDKLRLGVIAAQVKRTKDPARLREILEQNRDLVQRLIKKGVVSSQQVEEAEKKLKEMEAKGELCDLSSFL